MNSVGYRVLRAAQSFLVICTVYTNSNCLITSALANRHMLKALITCEIHIIAGVPGEKPYVTSDKLPGFSFQMSLYSVVNDWENLTLHQKSLKALFHTSLQLLY